MLTEPMRRKIKEHTWLEIENEDTNPTQTWRRLKDQSIEAIHDLTLLAKKLPEDKQKEIFSPAIIDSFIRQILYLGEKHPNQHSLNSRKAELAALLVNRGINVHSYQYLKLNEDTPALIKSTADQLKQCVSVCNDISYKLKLINVEEEAEKMKYRYLFSWNSMLGREKRKLLNFIRDKLGDNEIEIFQTKIKRSDKNIELSFGQTFDKEVTYGTFHMIINDSNTNAKVEIFDEVNGCMLELDLLVKESLGDYNLYMKRDNRTRSTL